MSAGRSGTGKFLDYYGEYGREEAVGKLLEWCRENGLTARDFPEIYGEAKRRWGLNRYEASELTKAVTGKLGGV